MVDFDRISTGSIFRSERTLLGGPGRWRWILWSKLGLICINSLGYKLMAGFSFLDAFDGDVVVAVL